MIENFKKLELKRPVKRCIRRIRRKISDNEEIIEEDISFSLSRGELCLILLAIAIVLAGEYLGLPNIVKVLDILLALIIASSRGRLSKIKDILAQKLKIKRVIRKV